MHANLLSMKLVLLKDQLILTHIILENLKNIYQILNKMSMCECFVPVELDVKSQIIFIKGFKNIYMLKGGIINYFNKIEPKKK